MPDSCCQGDVPRVPPDDRYRRVLVMALLLNAAMFGVELVASWWSGSLALMADAIDFFGDAVNYGISLAVLSLAVVWRSRTALLKGVVMAGFGLFVLVRAAWALVAGEVPEPFTMGAAALLALATNMGVAWMLYAFREGDANMRSVWLCSRNDAIGNIAVLVAALAVLLTGTRWPDLAVALVMGWLGLSAGSSVVKQARDELRASSGR